MKVFAIILLLAINLFFAYLIYNPEKSIKENLTPPQTMTKVIQTLNINNQIINIEETVPINNPESLGIINGLIKNKLNKTIKKLFSYPNSIELLLPKIEAVTESLAIARLASNTSCNKTEIYYPINTSSFQTAKIQLINNCQDNSFKLLINEEEISIEIEKRGCDINLCKNNQSLCLKSTPRLLSISTENKKIALDQELFCDIKQNENYFYPHLKINLDGWNSEINHLYFTLIVAKANAINKGKDDEIYKMLTYYFDTETKEIVPISSVPTNIFPFK